MDCFFIHCGIDLGVNLGAMFQNRNTTNVEFVTIVWKFHLIFSGHDTYIGHELQFLVDGKCIKRMINNLKADSISFNQINVVLLTVRFSITLYYVLLSETLWDKN